MSLLEFSLTASSPASRQNGPRPGCQGPDVQSVWKKRTKAAQAEPGRFCANGAAACLLQVRSGVSSGGSTSRCSTHPVGCFLNSRMYDACCSTIETASLRMFRYGRTDAIRVTSVDSLKFVQAMQDPSKQVPFLCERTARIRILKRKSRVGRTQKKHIVC